MGLGSVQNSELLLVPKLFNYKIQGGGGGEANTCRRWKKEVEKKPLKKELHVILTGVNQSFFKWISDKSKKKMTMAKKAEVNPVAKLWKVNLVVLFQVTLIISVSRGGNRYEGLN